MWCYTCKNTFVGACNLQMITYKFWCEYLDPVTGQIAAWYYLNSIEISHSLKVSKATAKTSFMYQQWTTTVHIFLKVPTTDSLVFFPKHISRTAFFVLSIRAIPYFPDGTFRDINATVKTEGKNVSSFYNFWIPLSISK